MIDVGKDLQSAYDYGYRQGVKDTLDDIHKTLERSLRERLAPLIKTEPNSSEKPNNCETCKHNKLEWYSEVCDGCSKAHSNYEPQMDEEQFCIEHKCTYYRPKEGGCTKNNGDCPFEEPQTDCAWK